MKITRWVSFIIFILIFLFTDSGFERFVKLLAIFNRILGAKRIYIEILLKNQQT